MLELRLKLDNLRCERDERVLFEGLSAEFNGGAIVQIAGVNGAGKTTLLRIICGLTSNYTGNVIWNNDATNTSYSFRSSLLYLGHAPALNTSLTPMENLQWYFGLNGFKSHQGETLDRDKLREDILSALQQTGMKGYEGAPCRMLSAGQQRRVALARIYCSEAPLWILDEPFTAIDINGVSELQKRFSRHMSKGGLILLTSHQALEMPALETLDLSAFRKAKA